MRLLTIIGEKVRDMEKYKYLILGAGPAGLTFANLLLQNGEESFLVIEKESEAGGLCRSHEVDGAPLDIGGGHFLVDMILMSFCLDSCLKMSGIYLLETPK